MQAIDPRQLQIEENEFYPVISSGELTLNVTGPNPEKYFLEITRTDTEEIVAASFLVEEKIGLKIYPLDTP